MNSDWEDFKASEAPSGEERFEPLAYSELYRVWILYDTREGDDSFRYVWNFYERTQSDAGLGDLDLLSAAVLFLRGCYR